MRRHERALHVSLSCNSSVTCASSGGESEEGLGHSNRERWSSTTKRPVLWPRKPPRTSSRKGPRRRPRRLPLTSQAVWRGTRPTDQRCGDSWLSRGAFSTSAGTRNSSATCSRMPACGISARRRRNRGRSTPRTGPLVDPNRRRAGITTRTTVLNEQIHHPTAWLIFHTFIDPSRLHSYPVQRDVGIM